MNAVPDRQPGPVQDDREEAAGSAGEGEVPASQWEGVGARDLARRWHLPAAHLFERVGSTNVVARALAALAAPDGALVLAEAQTAGKGRVGRGWHSPAGLGLWFSMIARPPVLRDPGAVPLLVAITAVKALEPLVGAGVITIKWPNDLLASGRKLGGILCEAVWEGGGAPTLVVGVGINVRHTAADFPPELQPHATSLALASGRDAVRLAVADAVIPALTARLRSPLQLGPEERSAFGDRDCLLGREVVVSDPVSGKETAAGVASGVASDGCLLLRVGADDTRKIHTGTVRPAG